jgi:hypothetical protein
MYVVYTLFLCASFLGPRALTSSKAKRVTPCGAILTNPIDKLITSVPVEFTIFGQRVDGTIDSFEIGVGKISVTDSVGWKVLGVNSLITDMWGVFRLRICVVDLLSLIVNIVNSPFIIYHSA